MTVSTPDELIAGFWHNILPKVTGKPSYEGGGRHGHLGLIMKNDEYFALATDVFTTLDNPGATPVHPDKATAARIADANRAHKEATRIYCTNNNVDQEFKRLIIDASEAQFLNALSDEVVGYENITSMNLLTNLLTYYAEIAPRNSRRTTSGSTRHMTPINLLIPCSSRLKTLKHLRSLVVNIRGTQLLLILLTLLFLAQASLPMLAIHGKCAW
jgi:hypothetical protein